ncbi:MAG: glycosyltransferase family 2 protein [Rikenellaceae bacterium]
MLISVVILNWNGADFLRKYLPGVVKHTAMVADSEVIVVDNHSSDDSVKLLKNEFNEVKIIELDKNYGFTGGYNRAIKRVDSKYVMLMNSDIMVNDNYLEPLIQYMEQHDDCAAVMPKILSLTEPSKFEYAGAAGGFLDFLCLPYCRGRVLSKVESDLGQYNDVCEVFWASGAAMVVRGNLYKELGGLDDEFCMHMEEIDLCWRMKNKGYKIAYIGTSKVYHLGGGTLSYGSPRKLYYNFRNSLLMMYKNLPSKYMFIIPLRMCFDGLVALTYLATFKYSLFKTVIEAHCDYRIALTTYKQKRASTLRNEKLMSKSLLLIKYLQIRNKK